MDECRQDRDLEIGKKQASFMDSPLGKLYLRSWEKYFDEYEMKFIARVESKGSDHTHQKIFSSNFVLNFTW